MLANHAGERGAIAPPIEASAHLIGGGALQLQVLGDIVGHLLVDQRKHPALALCRVSSRSKTHKREKRYGKTGQSNQAGY